MLAGRNEELNALNTAFRQMLEGKGGVLFLTGEAGLGKTTLVHEWWKSASSPALFSEAACSIPIGNVDVGRLEALQPWADIVAGIQSQEVNTETPASEKKPDKITDKKADKKKLLRDVAPTIALGLPVIGGIAHAAFETSRLIQEQRETAKANPDAQGSRPALDMRKLIHDAAPAWAWALPFVGDLAHAAIETHRIVKDRRGESAASAVNQQQVFQQYSNLLTRISEHLPLVIFLDDMHWADVSSTNLLFYISREITSKKILVIVTYRPGDALNSTNGERHPILQVQNEILRYSAGKELSLHHLDRAAIHAIMQTTFAEYKTDDTFEAWLEKISGGNSLFITQFIRTLREDGALDANGKFIGKYDAITIPDSALAVVKERTARLDEGTRELLRYATAEGEEFTSFVLGKLAQKPPLELLQQLRKAEKEGIVRNRESTRMFANQTTSVFGFSHALFHKALYDALLPEEREILHRECFNILKAEWDASGNAQEHSLALASKLLTHAEKCGERETAAEVALAAARIAWSTYAGDEALAMLVHARRLTEQERTLRSQVMLMDALLLQAMIRTLRGQFAESLESSSQAYDLARSVNDVSRTAAALNRKAAVLVRQGKLAASKEEAMKALAFAEEAGDLREQARALESIGNTEDALGAYTSALEHHTRSLKIRESLGDRREIARSLGNIGNAYKDLADYDNALTHYTRCMEIFESLGDRYGVATSLTNIGSVKFNLGAYAEALECYEKSMAFEESIGDRSGIAISLDNLGNVYLELGDHVKALERFNQSLAMKESIGDRYGAAITLGNIGGLHAQLGAFEYALSYLTRSLKIKESIGDRRSQAITLINIGVAHRNLGELEKARQAIERARDIGYKIGGRYVQGYALCELGSLGEDEAMTLQGEQRAATLRDAVRDLEEGVGILREIKHAMAQQFEEELERVKKL
ncbi:MAG TPA: tetratricopeptide repeat protein [Candidatus Kapabacteria bacterium]|nr:tetratricopeptide repeat protein [Candidatus Kapabacteria bacterium]